MARGNTFPAQKIMPVSFPRGTSSVTKTKSDAFLGTGVCGSMVPGPNGLSTAMPGVDYARG